MPRSAQHIPEGVTHSHPDDATDVHVVEQTCVHCKTPNRFTVPDDHDGHAVHFECAQCGERNKTEGWDPAERAIAGTRPVVPCANCGAPVTLVSDQAVCGACGVRNVVVMVKVAGEGGKGKESQNRR